ncbi:MAG: hypothetical protein MK200_09085 [Nitrosopumilus sp.]|jgi:hypothetical protein|nr:hypothetical protein [Nitrosopumilus sp.]
MNDKEKIEESLEVIGKMMVQLQEDLDTLDDSKLEHGYAYGLLATAQKIQLGEIKKILES